MDLGWSFLGIFIVFLSGDLCKSEFVPVYMWGTGRTSEPVPALHKTSQSFFKDEITNQLKSNSLIVIFAEQSLSPEDFGQRDRSGNTAFPNLSKVKKSSKVSYFPYVQNSIKAAKHASDDVAEISIERLKENFKIPEAEILIIDLNDATENEQRFDMLKRHDDFIASTYDNLSQKHGNVLALYTAHHASWIESGEVHSRKTRAVVSAANQFFDNSTIMLYSSGSAVVTVGGKTHTVDLTYKLEENLNSSIVLSASGLLESKPINVSFNFTKTVNGYWYLQETKADYDEKTINRTATTIYAPLGFSYACGNQTFKGTDMTIVIPEFQVQPMFKHTYLTKQLKFDDPYNCVGFTTIPIWSGLFVTFILLLIMTFGLTMMMDIKTMDRFDDAKGKTITINTSE
ncbi:unnamed protein product [Ceutorhynchus assimilis]|uniref:V-type proton ATPase subunit S1 n=1 Tax=Ceutorhynchus assimilis TaxID=467358 RepID=A0A9N9MDP8_9CUCU|nr:unnamed protein product [Ceutorhynchus assimilis]